MPGDHEALSLANLEAKKQAQKEEKRKAEEAAQTQAAAQLDEQHSKIRANRKTIYEKILQENPPGHFSQKPNLTILEILGFTQQEAEGGITLLMAKKKRDELLLKLFPSVAMDDSALTAALQIINTAFEQIKSGCTEDGEYKPKKLAPPPPPKQTRAQSTIIPHSTDRQTFPGDSPSELFSPEQLQYIKNLALSGDLIQLRALASLAISGHFNPQEKTIFWGLKCIVKMDKNLNEFQPEMQRKLRVVVDRVFARLRGQGVYIKENGTQDYNLRAAVFTLIWIHKRSVLIPLGYLSEDECEQLNQILKGIIKRPALGGSVSSTHPRSGFTNYERQKNCLEGIKSKLPEEMVKKSFFDFFSKTKKTVGQRPINELKDILHQAQKANTNNRARHVLKTLGYLDDANEPQGELKSVLELETRRAELGPR